MINERIQPCDRMMIPIYITYRNNDGVRVDADMFAESKTICIRWYDDAAQMHQRIIRKPKLFWHGRNYFDPEKRNWKYAN